LVYTGREKEMNSGEKEYGVNAYGAIMATYIAADLAAGLFTLGAAGANMVKNINIKDKIEYGVTKVQGVTDTAKSTWVEIGDSAGTLSG
jgi:hypothetical protein